MVQAIYPLISEDSNMSVKRMKKVLTKENGQQIGGFFGEILKALPNKKKVHESISALNELLKLITSFGLGDYLKLKAILTEKNGQQIGKFFSSIFNEIEGKKIPDLKPLNEFLKVLSGIGVVGAIGLLALKPILNEKFGKSISAFFKALVSGLTKDRITQINEFTKAVKTISTAMLIMAGTIGIMAAEIAYFGVLTILESLTVTSMFVGVTIMLMKTLGKSRGDISKGTAALKEVMKALTLLSVNVVILAATASMLQDVQWETLGKMGAIIAVLSGIAVGAMWLSDKWSKGGDKALKTMAGLSILLVSTSLAIGIVANVARKYEVGEIAVGLGAIALVIGGGFLAVKLLEKANKKFDKALTALGSLIALMTATALVLNFVVAPLAEKIGEVIAGGVVVLATIALMTGIVHWLSKIPGKNLDKATLTLAKITALFGIISLVSLFILPAIGANWKDAAVGAIAVFGIIAVMTGVVVGLAALSKRGLITAGMSALWGITGIFTIISVVAATMLIPIGKNPLDVAIGLGVVTGIIAVMAGITYFIGKPAFQKRADLALITMGIMTVMMGVVSILALFVFPKIAEQWKEAALGAAVVLGIVGVMALMTWGLHNLVKNTNIKQAYLTLGVLTVMLAAVAYITDEFLIPIGYEWKDAAKGAAVVLGIIGVMGVMVWALGKIEKKDLIKGGLALVGIEAIIWFMDKAFKPYLELLDKISGRRKDILKSSAALALIIGGWGVLMGAVGALVKNPAVAIALAVGAATIAGISGVLWAISQMLPDYVDLTLLIHKNWSAIKKGSAEIVLIIGGWGLLFGAIGAIVANPIVAGILAAGAAAVAGISAVLNAIGKMMPVYVYTAKLISENKAALRKAGKLLPELFSNIGFMLAKIGVIYGNPISALAISAGASAVKMIGDAIKAIQTVVNPLVTIMSQIDKNGITQASIQKLNSLFAGKGGIADAIKNIVSKMADVGLWSSTKAHYIAKMIKPVFDTLATFIGVITNTLNLRYVTEWDKDGKPVAYATVTSDQLAHAGKVISQAFGVFLTELGKGMKALKGTSLFAMQMMAASIGPIMRSVGTFANAITAVMSKGIADQWDKDGKATHFKPFNKDEFKNAAVAISSAFGTFLETLGPHLEKLSGRAVAIIQQMGKGILPVMQAVATFTDMVTGIIVGKELTYTDSTGQQVTKLVKIDQTQFATAGKTIADAFTQFIENLWGAFKDAEYTDTIKHTFKADEVKHGNHMVEIINGLQNVGTIIDAVSSFVDVIAKSVEQQKKVNLAAAGKQMAAMLINFVAQLQRSFKTEAQRQIVQNISDCMGDVDTLIKKSGNAYKRLNSIFEKSNFVVTIEDVNKMFEILGAFGNSETINIMKSIKKRDVADLTSYFKIVHQAAKYLNKMPELMTEPEITTAITAFLKDIKLLTQEDVRDDVVASRRAMSLFNKDVKRFSTTINRSRKFIIKFTSSMNKATKALRDFDDGIIKREHERNAALKSFADMVQNIADSVESLKTQIEALDENKIVSSFKGITSVIEMARGLAGSVFGGSDDKDNKPAQ